MFFVFCFGTMFVTPMTIDEESNYGLLLKFFLAGGRECWWGQAYVEKRIGGGY